MLLGGGVGVRVGVAVGLEVGRAVGVFIGVKSAPGVAVGFKADAVPVGTGVPPVATCVQILFSSRMAFERR